MIKVFENLKSHDEKAINEYKCDSNILMEIAGANLAQVIKEIAYKNEYFYQDYKSGFLMEIPRKKTIQIVCGPSDNGGDGLVLSRLLQDDFNVITVLPFLPKSNMCGLQKKRLDLLGIKTQDYIEDFCDILVDSLFGTGFKGEVRDEFLPILKKMNEIKAYKIACDVPSALDIEGIPKKECFKADLTICIGALRIQLFSSFAKDYVGQLILKRLPLPIDKYEGESDFFLLQKEDAKLPHRNKQNMNKGSFGHVCIVEGEKAGASQLAAASSLIFGAGLVTICGKNVPFAKPDFMYSKTIIKEASCIAIGQGLGREKGEAFYEFLDYVSRNAEIPLVLDADILLYKEITSILKLASSIVLTPHPKEFQTLLENTLGISFSVDDIRKKKIALMKEFCAYYPNVVLLLKDCNTFICSNEKIYINSLGNVSLAKGGTGDVLTGLIASCLAQGYSLLDSAITSSIAHALASHHFKNNYALTASALIEKIGKL
ncbi:MAG: NAD(P)H-hydrate dehydratase [Treponema sp.]